MSCGPYYANPVIRVGSCDPQLKSGSWHDIWTLSYKYSNAAFGSYYSHVKEGSCQLEVIGSTFNWDPRLKPKLVAKSVKIWSLITLHQQSLKAIRLGLLHRRRNSQTGGYEQSLGKRIKLVGVGRNTRENRKRM